MKKAALIIDMPEYCGECPLMDDDPISEYCTAHYHDYLDMDCMGGKPNWCPLKEIPDNGDN